MNCLSNDPISISANIPRAGNFPGSHHQVHWLSFLELIQFNVQFTCYQSIVHYRSDQRSDDKPMWLNLPPLSYFVVWLKYFIAPCSATSMCHHVMENPSSVKPIRSDGPMKRWAAPSRLSKIQSDSSCQKPQPPHSSSNSSQAICFKKGESNNSLALGLFS